MRNFQLRLVLVIAFFLFTAFKKNVVLQTNSFTNSIGTNSPASGLEEPVSVDIGDITVIQGEKGERPVKLLVFLSQPAKEPVIVDYTTENGTAIAGIDYVASSGSLRFEPGQTAKWITVSIIGEVAENGTAIADVDYATSSGSLRFEPGQTAKWVTVSIIGEVAASPNEDAGPVADVKLSINLTRVQNAILKKSSASITIIKNIMRDARFKTGNKSVYEVAFVYTGYTTISVNRENCSANRLGQVLLRGLLEGFEKVGLNEDVVYRGVLQLTIDMGLCSIETELNGEHRYCSLLASGIGKVMVELQLKGNSGQPAYININHDPGQHGHFVKLVDGDCYSQIAEEKEMIPNKSITSIFNGFELEMLDVASGGYLKKLRPGQYSQKDQDGNKTVVFVLRKIR
jgi:urease beta subunit